MQKISDEYFMPSLYFSSAVVFWAFWSLVKEQLLFCKNFISILGNGKVIEEIPIGKQFFRELWKYLHAGNDAPVVISEEYDRRNGKF